MSAERISVPELLARPRDHAVICTFGANLDFYEGPLWRHVSRARNRIVLADDVVLAGQLADLASGGSRLRHVNRHYLATPITNERSAHAKLILLADAAGATLLVGSGNLSIDGYASRGEVFYRYDLAEDDDTYLPELQATKSFLDLLVERDYVDHHAAHHLNAVWSDTPWVWSASSRPAGVRHNLEEPLGDQLVAAIGGEHVEELIVHAPFHDERCEALRRLLVALHPDRVTVLVQAGRTSVDATALATVLAASGTEAEVQLAAAPEFPDTYLHAKFVLARTTTRSVTFTGSANVSLAALWRTDRPVGDRPAGNIELVNLAEGPPERFDELLAGLDLVEPAGPVTEIDVRYIGNEEAAEGANRPRLTRGTWTDGTLTLVAANSLPDGPLTLVVAGTTTDSAIEADHITYRCQPPPEISAVLDARPVPAWLRIATSDGDVDTTPVYPYHAASLAGLLTGRRDPELLRKAGSLDMEAYDDDLAALLDELDAALVIDRQSLWRLARRSPPPDTDTGDGPRRAWEDLDFDALRRHPRLAQYDTSTGRADRRLDATDLQIVLGAITDHFRGFGADATDPRATGATAPQVEGVVDVDLDDLTATLPGDDDSTLTDESPEELESETEDDVEREHRRLKLETRNRLAWQRFTARFTKALRDAGFVEVVGPRVAVTNALILNHLLALLVSKGVVAPDKGVAAQIDLWSFLFGDAETMGYLDTLPEEDQLATLDTFADRGVEVSIIAAVDLAAQLTKQHSLEHLREPLRNTWRRILAAPTLCFTADVLRQASKPGIRTATALATSLASIAREATRRDIDTAIAAALGVTRSQLFVREEAVQRGRQRDTVEIVEVNAATIELSVDAALAAFRAAVAADPRRDYVRIKHVASGVVACWDRREHDCWRYAPNDEDPTDLDEPTDIAPAWLAATNELVATARNVDAVAA